MASTTTPRRSDTEGEEAAAAAAGAAAALVSRCDYPLFVVTAADGADAAGCLAGFVTQCSIVPARFLVCVSKLNHTYAVAAEARALALHLLGEDQLELASVFGELTGDSTEKMSRIPWHPGALGAPVLEECAAWVEGEVLARLDLGDHVGHLIEPRSGGGGGHPGGLRYSAARDLRPGHPPDEAG